MGQFTSHHKRDLFKVVAVVKNPIASLRPPSHPVACETVAPLLYISQCASLSPLGLHELLLLWRPTEKRLPILQSTPRNMRQEKAVGVSHYVCAAATQHAAQLVCLLSLHLQRRAPMWQAVPVQAQAQATATRLAARASCMPKRRHSAGRATGVAWTWTRRWTT